LEAPISYRLEGFRAFWEPHLIDREREARQDALVPVGFCSDLCLALKGIGTSTLFTLWAGLFAVSTALKRDAWISWYPSALLPNLYVILSAPPGLLKKTTVIDFVDRILSIYHLFCSSKRIAVRKKIHSLRGEITPEALYEKLESREEKYYDEETGMFKKETLHSQLAILVSELSSLLDAKAYKEGLITLLTSLYDGRALGNERETKTGGLKKLQDEYVTLLGGLTPEQMAALPEAALGGGFMSRTIVVHEEHANRVYPVPLQIPGAPDITELAKRLAWIAENATGTYHLSENAYALYTHWYREFLERVLDPKSGASTDERNRKARMDTLLLRIALLVRAQRYEIGSEIEAEDILLADRLLHSTFEANKEAIEQLSAASIQRKWSLETERTLYYIKRAGSIKRNILLQRMYKYATAKQVTEIVNQLKQMGCIRILSPRGVEVEESNEWTHEVYVFVKNIPSAQEIDRVLQSVT